MAEIGGVWVDWVNDPRIIWIGSDKTEITIQDLIDTIRGVLEYDLGALDDPTLISEAGGKQFLGGTTFVGITLELNNAVVAFEARSTDFYDGYVTTADDADAYGDTLIDAYATFVSLSTIPGDLIYNHTDNSKSTVLSVRSETELITTALTGGITNKYNLNDLYDLYHITACEVSGGNLVAVDYDGYNINQILPTFGTQVKVTAASSATRTEDSAIQFASFNGAVHLDEYATGQFATGTAYPSGNPEFPVNNAMDAVVIAKANGFDTILVKGNYIFTTGDNIEGFIISGQNYVLSKITIEPAAQTLDCTFQNCTILGVLDGNSTVERCTIYDLEYAEGAIHKCIFKGTVTLGGSLTTEVVACSSGISGSSVSIINMGGPGRNLELRQHSGGIKITNMTGASQGASLDFVSGHVLIDSTCTDGEIIIRGVVTVTDNSGPGCTVNVDGAISTKSVVQSVWSTPQGFVHIDLVHGESGTEYPIGTYAMPSNNLADAYEIGLNLGIHIIKFHADGYNNPLILDAGVADWNGWTFGGDSTTANDVLFLNSANVSRCHFQKCSLFGTLVGENYEFVECLFYDLSGFSGTSVMKTVEINGTVSLNPGSTLLGEDIHAIGAQSIVDLGGPGSVFKSTIDGDIIISNLVDGAPSPGIVSLSLIAGTVTRDSSCTGGILTLQGIGTLINNGIGGIISDEMLNTTTIDAYLSANHGENSWEGSGDPNIIAAAVWDELRSGHTDSGSFGESIRLDATGLETDVIIEIDAYLSTLHGAGNWEGSGSAGAIAEAVWDAYRADHTIPNTFGGDFSDSGVTVEEIDAYLSANHGEDSWEGSGSAGIIAAAVWDELRSGHTDIGSFGESIRLDALGLEADAIIEIDAYLSGEHGSGSWEGSGSAGIIAAAVWDELLIAHQVSGSAGEALGDGYSIILANLDAMISSRAVPGDAMDLITDAVDANALATDAIAEIDAYLSSIHGSDSWEGDTADTVANAVWSEVLPGSFGVGTAGERLATADDRIDQTLSTVEDNIRGSDDRDLTEMAGTGFVSATDSLAAADDDRTAIKSDTAAILLDTDEMQGKLPTNNIMGSSVKTDKDDEIDAILADTADMQPKIGSPVTGTMAGDLVAITTQIIRVLGLTHENAFIDNTIYDDFGQVTSSRIRIYNSKANTEAATDGGSGTTGLIATYTMTTVYEAKGRVKSYRMVKE